jgi:hypothetical protein
MPTVSDSPVSAMVIPVSVTVNSPVTVIPIVVGMRKMGMGKTRMGKVRMGKVGMRDQNGSRRRIWRSA